jgi:hypothetical protein
LTPWTGTRVGIDTAGRITCPEPSPPVVSAAATKPFSKDCQLRNNLPNCSSSTPEAEGRAACDARNGAAISALALLFAVAGLLAISNNDPSTAPTLANELKKTTQSTLVLGPIPCSAIRSPNRRGSAPRQLSLEKSG